MRRLIYRPSIHLSSSDVYLSQSKSTAYPSQPLSLPSQPQTPTASKHPPLPSHPTVHQLSIPSTPRPPSPHHTTPPKLSPPKSTSHQPPSPFVNPPLIPSSSQSSPGKTPNSSSTSRTPQNRLTTLNRDISLLLLRCLLRRISFSLSRRAGSGSGISSRSTPVCVMGNCSILKFVESSNSPSRSRSSGEELRCWIRRRRVRRRVRVARVSVRLVKCRAERVKVPVDGRRRVGRNCVSGFCGRTVRVRDRAVDVRLEIWRDLARPDMGPFCCLWWS
ncbi:hypothetical protein FB567DRAFT_529345 [Paraphoma chrysanthemicola]|uniref:Uncharacterized protein n=1 Tax=Paraphoma chrysanthemicola TaxID=798071 RepID=A0A8K0R1S1_9PLEO|nr:hypothetical protein FB567DRAFT_529345 [Paraphoma chrysanthemicola]